MTSKKPKNLAIAYILLMVLPGLDRLYLGAPQWWIFLAIILAQFIFFLANLMPLVWGAAAAYFLLFAYDVWMIPKWTEVANS